VKAQKQRYQNQNKDKLRTQLNRWRSKNPEKVKAQKHRHRERILDNKPGKPCQYDVDEILREMFEEPVVVTDVKRSSLQQRSTSSQKPSKTEVSCSSTDSETDEELAKELEVMMAEPEDPVKMRISQIRNNRKKAEEKSQAYSKKTRRRRQDCRNS